MVKIFRYFEMTHYCVGGAVVTSTNFNCHVEWYFIYKDAFEMKSSTKIKIYYLKIDKGIPFGLIFSV